MPLLPGSRCNNPGAPCRLPQAPRQGRRRSVCLGKLELELAEEESLKKRGGERAQSYGSDKCVWGEEDHGGGGGWVIWEDFPSSQGSG